MAKMRYVQIKWLDACHLQDGRTKEEIKNLTAHPTTSMGMLVRSDDIYVLAQSWDEDSYSELMIIPRGMVVEVKDL